MYDEIYSLNFFNSFLISSLFLIINIIFAFNVSLKAKNYKILNLGNYQPIIFFFLIFCLYSSIFNISLLVGSVIVKYVFFLLLLFKFFFILKNYKYLFDKFNLKFFSERKIIFAFFILFYLISILPMSDADSIVVFQNIPATILNQGFNGLNIARDIEFTVLSNTETLLLLSSILKSDNFGSQLNLVSLIFLACVTFKENKNFPLIIFSSPLIIYFLSAQKLQLFFGLLYLLLFILIHKKIIKKKFELFIIVLLLTFYSSGKITYILFSIPLFVYLLKNNIKFFKNIIFYLIVSVLIIYGPILSIKQIYFGNILAPFFDNLFGNNSEIYNAFALSLRSSEGWLSDPSNIYLYLRPFVSFEISKISSSLGIIFLFMLVDYKLQKQLLYIPLLLVVLILCTGQILPRYYFEAFLLLSFFYNYRTTLIKLIIYFQLIAVISMTLVFAYISYIKFNVFQNKTNYQNEFAYSFYNAQQIKKDSLEGNILDFSLDRDSIYLSDNIYSLRYINVLNKYNQNKTENLTNFIKENSIKYLVVYDKQQIPGCIETEEINETTRKKSVRNFLVETQKNNYKIVEIKDNKCN